MEPTGTDRDSPASDPLLASPPRGAPEAAAPAPPPRPAAVWPAIPGALLLYLGGTLVGGFIAVIVQLAVLAQRASSSPGVRPSDGLRDALEQPGFLALSLVLAQSCIVVFTLLAARNAGRPWRERLGLVRGCLPARDLPTLVLACFGALAAGLAVAASLHEVGWLPELGSSRKGIGLALRDSPLALQVALVFVASVLVGPAEELVFRGYLQRALLTRWRPAPAIGVSSVLFVLLHGDVTYDVFVLPIGVLLGYLAWRADSIVPTIVGHVTVNALAQSGLVLSAHVGDRWKWLEDPRTVDPHGAALAWSAAAAFVAGAALVGLGVWRVERRLHGTGG